MRSGIAILNVFAAIWAWAALGSLGAPTWIWPLPILVSGAIVRLCWRKARAAEPSPDVARQVWRVVGFWSAAEGVFIAIGVAMMFRIGSERLIAPLIDIIVGLHFVGLARALPLRAYHGTGLGLIAVGAAALFLPAGSSLTVTGFGAALILWCTSVWISIRSRGARG